MEDDCSSRMARHGMACLCIIYTTGGGTMFFCGIYIKYKLAFTSSTYPSSRVCIYTLVLLSEELSNLYGCLEKHPRLLLNAVGAFTLGLATA